MANEITLATPESRNTTVTAYRITRVVVFPIEQRMEIFVEKLDTNGNVIDSDCCKCANVDQTTLDTLVDTAVAHAQGAGKIPPSV